MNSPLAPRIVLLNKPFQVLCQFSEHENKKTLSAYIRTPDIYAAGRLDYDSEGLLVLTDSGPLQNLITHPQNKLEKTYWVQVEGDIPDTALQQLAKGVPLKDGVTLPAKAHRIAEPNIWARNPPIRERANLPTSWIELRIKEGKNRQVRRMTAAVGYPTLRLIRYSIGPWNLNQLQPGDTKEGALTPALEAQLLSKCNRKPSAKSPAARNRKFAQKKPGYKKKGSR